MKHSSRRAGSSALLALLVLCLPAAARPQDDVVARVIAEGRTHPLVMQHLEYLTERIGPRLTGSPSMERASRWAEARFASFGLEARLERWGEFPVGFERGPSRGGMVTPLHMDYVFATNAWSAGTPGPVRAPAVLYPRSFEELEGVRASLTGAWVVELPRSEQPKKKVRARIDAVLDEVGIAGRIRGTGPLVHTGGRYRISSDALPTDVRVHLQAEYYTDLKARLERGEAVELEFDIDNRFLPGPMPQYNVIADLVGSELPDEYVYVGGHLDSWDGAQGAQDNATGCATTLEAARLLAVAGARPRRTIRFILWGGEEQGLLGSRADVGAHPELAERISCVLVHDGGTNYLSGLAGPAALVGQLREACAPLFDLNSAMPFQVTENAGLGGGGGSDHASYVAAGIPAFFWHQTGRAPYGFIHHTQHDTRDEVVPEYQRHSALVVALAAHGIANLDEKLDRTDLLDPDRGRRGGDPTRRRMGVSLDGTTIENVVGGLAAKAKWQAGDVILAIDGVKVATMAEVVGELQKGGPKKVFTLRRGEQTLESVLDYTASPSEKARAERRARGEAETRKAAGEDSGGR